MVRGTPRAIEIREDIALIPLTRGLFAIIDAADVHLVSGRHWRAIPSRNTFYAGTSIKKDGKWTTLSLHQVIAGLCEQVDHSDRDGLNCRRSNLRPSTYAQNMQNTGLWATNTSGRKGVTWNRKDKRWQAQIRINGKQTYLGGFVNIDDAAAAYEAAAKQHHGDFFHQTERTPTWHTSSSPIMRPSTSPGAVMN